jgi:hypothetical protein
MPVKPKVPKTKPEDEIAAIEEAVAAIDADALATVKVPWRGHDFEVPKFMDEWDTDACIAIGDGSYIAAAKILLGSRQWKTLHSLGPRRKDMREFLVVFATIINEECVD